MASICGPLQALPFSRPHRAPEGYTQGRVLEVWQRGHLAPQSILPDIAQVPEEEPLCLRMQPWFLEGMKLCVSVPHFLHPCQRFASFLEADAGCIARDFIPAGHYITPPVTSRPSFGLITHDIQSVLPFL